VETSCINRQQPLQQDACIIVIVLDCLKEISVKALFVQCKYDWNIDKGAWHKQLNKKKTVAKLNEFGLMQACTCSGLTNEYACIWSSARACRDTGILLIIIAMKESVVCYGAGGILGIPTGREHHTCLFEHVRQSADLASCCGHHQKWRSQWRLACRLVPSDCFFSYRHYIGQYTAFYRQLY